MNYKFLELYEELSALNEAKADMQRLVDFAGQELADRFLAIRDKLKSPENDLYYWIKNKTPGELDAYIRDRESTKSATQIKKEISETGAEEEIREHEETCLWNYTKRTCYTCKHMENLFTKVKCKLDDTKIPEGKYIEQCACWEFNEKDHTKKTPNVFGVGGLFGGI